MADTYVVGFDGTASSKRAVRHAADHAKATGGTVHIVHVLEWSPYSFLTPEELSERHKRRKQELERAEEIVQPVADDLKKQGIEASSEVCYGHGGELLCEIAEKLEAREIIIGRTGTSPLTARLMGSLALSLVQAAPLPVTVVP